MTIKEHIGYAQKALDRCPEAAASIQPEIDQWTRIDALVKACRAKYPGIDAHCDGLSLPVRSFKMAVGDDAGMAICNALASMESHGDIEPQPSTAQQP